MTLPHVTPNLGRAAAAQHHTVKQVRGFEKHKIEGFARQENNETLSYAEECWCTRVVHTRMQGKVHSVHRAVSMALRLASVARGVQAQR